MIAVSVRVDDRGHRLVGDFLDLSLTTRVAHCLRDGPPGVQSETASLLVIQ
jgi:hypothetical protein